MNALEIILGVIQLIMAVVIICVVLLQNGRSARLSGAIAGGAETFFGKNKGRAIDSKLNKWTGIIAAGLVIVTMILNIVV